MAIPKTYNNSDIFGMVVMEIDGGCP